MKFRNFFASLTDQFTIQQFRFFLPILVLGLPGLSFAERPQCVDTSVQSQSVKARQKPVKDYLKNLSWDVIQNMGPEEIYAYKLYARLTGSGISLESPRFKRIVKLVKSKKFADAAKVATDDERFLKVRIRNFAAPFSSKDFSTTEPFNDLQAMIIGVVRDEVDARQILTGNFRYNARAGLGFGQPTEDSNLHYQQIEAGEFNFLTDLEQVTPQWKNLPQAAGALTTRAWAKINYDAGTNRRTVRNAIEAFLCAPIDSWKTRAVPEFFVRRDVDRAPGGNPSTYQNNCRSCHAIMDGMAGAFAKVDFVNDTLTLSADTVGAKMNQNANVYPEGYVTTDDSWTNLMIYASSIDFGWRSEMTGEGIVSFANMLAQTKAFSGCMVQKVFTEVCGANISDVDPQFQQEIFNKFEGSNRNLKQLFIDIAISPACLAHSN